MGLREMLKAFVTAGIVVLSIMSAGCASQTGWSPTVDPYNDPDAGRIQSDLSDCRQLAQQAGSDAAASAAKGAAVGSLLGAATGAAIGAVTGSAGAGAAIGAATGGVGGATREGIGSDDQFKRAYSNCMRNRGHNVIN
jgi:phage tail tape-measure protein